LEATQIRRELALHYFKTDCFEGSSNLEGTGSTLFSGGLFWKCGGNWLHIIIWRIVLEGSSDLAGTGSTLFSDRLFWRQLKFGGNWLPIIFQQIVLEAAQIWRELAPHYFPADRFGGSSNLEGIGSTLFSNRLFWKFGGNWLHIIFWRIVSEAAQISRELAPHYFLIVCFGCSSNLEGTGSTLSSREIVLEAAQIWRELAPHYFLADCFGNLEGTGSTLFSGGLFWRQLKYGGNWLHIILPDCFAGSSNLEGTGSTLFSNRLFSKQLKFGENWLHIIIPQIVFFEAAQIWRELAPYYFPVDCFGNLEGTDSTLFCSGLFRRQLRFNGNWLHIIFQQIVLEAAQIWRELAPHYFLKDNGNCHELPYSSYEPVILEKD
jgi:hypothetical protein